MIPTWLTLLSITSLLLGLACAIWFNTEMKRNPPHMAVMALVWPLCALFGSLAVVAFYKKSAGHHEHQHHDHAGKGHQQHEHTAHQAHHQEEDALPWSSVAKGAFHCGAGCALGDILAESLAFAVPAVLLPFGYPELFSERIFAVWGLDFVFAFILGIIFQYFAIAPMRGLGLIEGLVAALKADTLSLISWQVGMYGLMAIAHFWLFKQVLGTEVTAADPLFWFAMQFAMLAGFCTALPVNRWLIRKGIKEAM